MVAYVRKACDLYNQHRVDPETPIENTLGALAELVKERTCRCESAVQENLEVVKVQLSSEELSEIRQIINSSEIIGERYTATKKLVNRNTLKKLKNSNMKRDCSHFQIKSLQENQVDQLSRNSGNSPRNPQPFPRLKHLCQHPRSQDRGFKNYCAIKTNNTICTSRSATPSEVKDK
ncbi:hypothetical protein RhiirA4_516644 [Rhizophagus irregularis]|uniref:Uncharacterized protein n=1 Tax=Rhizophagus irregularis TaxID=588596 RepID=A0A2I1GFM5_9GLOM|nr:hypothetical protein RhiirA4_516644 [Rhizophagus irregularis]